MSSKSGKPRGHGSARLATLGVLLALAASLWANGLIDGTADPLSAGRPGFQASYRIEDRDGGLLYEVLSARDSRSQWSGLEDLSPHIIEAALAAEDRRFFQHPGVDPWAAMRALGQALRARRIVSGASTITMQLVRLLDPKPRTLRNKIREMSLALRLERSHSKREILEEYLNRVPFGNLAYGVPAAAGMYLGKSPGTLSPAEAAFLMALPQAPTLLNPHHNPDRALARRNMILGRMARLGFIDENAEKRARAEPLNLAPSVHPIRAPHFVTHARGLLPPDPPPRVRTTIDPELQDRVEALVAEAVQQSRMIGIHQAAAVVMNHRTREILAWAGSKDYFDPREGQNDGVLARRQPGSTMKPFTYATAFDLGFSPAALILDGPVEYGLKRGVYTPSNYAKHFHGPVALRTALASSLNVPAVKLLARVGVSRVLEKMRAAGFASLSRDPDFYGLGLTLGCGEVSLLELANAYACLASGGTHRPPVFFKNVRQPKEGVRVFSPEAAYLVTHILGDDAARATGFGRDSLLSFSFPVAAKTGTSKNFRDNWTVGYTSEVVVAVWAGNFDARPMGRVSGISGAGPLWRKIMRLAADRYPPKAFLRPAGIVEMKVCSDTGLPPGPDCANTRREIFQARYAPGPGSESSEEPSPRPEKRAVYVEEREKPVVELAIRTPRSGERYLYDPGIEPEFQNLRLSARVPPMQDNLIWSVNGRVVARVPVREGQRNGAGEFYWPLEKGRQRITVEGLVGGLVIEASEVTIEVY